MTGVANIIAVARREYTSGSSTRSFLFGTLSSPQRRRDRVRSDRRVPSTERTSRRSPCTSTATDLPSDPVTTVSVPPQWPADPNATTTAAKPDYVVTAVPDLAAARRAVIAGQYTAVLEIDRTRDGDLAFTLYTNDNATGRTAALIHQASTSIAVGDRLARLGVVRD